LILFEILLNFLLGLPIKQSSLNFFFNFSVKSRFVFLLEASSNFLISEETSSVDGIFVWSEKLFFN